MNLIRYAAAIGIAWVCLVLVPFSPCLSEEAAGGRVTHREEVSILHVDQYGVYVPNRIFYWDESQGKSAVEKLQRQARQLRNKRAALTYSARGDAAVDRRPLVVSLEAAPGDPGTAGTSLPTAQEPYEIIGDASTIQGRSGPTDETVHRNVGKYSDRYAEQPSFSQGWEESHPGAAETSGEPQDWDSPLETPHVLYSSSAAPDASTITREEITDFIQTLLNLNNNKALGALLEHYGDVVDYYDRGLVNRNYIGRDMSNYFKNWDTVFSGLHGDVVVIVTDERDVRVAKFLSRFHVRNAQRSVKGVTENIWRLRKENGRLKLVGVKQTVLSREILPP